MPRAKSRRRKSAAPEFQTYLFEVKEWEPTYSLSVNHDRREDKPYSEHVTIHFVAPCIFPLPLAGRLIDFHFFGERDHMRPLIFQRDPDWRPLCVGSLEFRPEQGNFYSSVPLENLPFILTAFAHGKFRFVSLWGPTLKRNKSLCTSMSFEQSVNLDEY